MHRLLLALIAAAVSFGCSQSTIDSTDDFTNTSGDGTFEESPPPIGAVPVNGEAGFCTTAAKCSTGQGDCNTSAQCQTGLACVNDKGAQFGFGFTTDMCLPAHCGNAVLDGGESGIDCGGPDCGLCQVCPATELNGAGDFCSASCRCDKGEGDCDNNQQCSVGLVCALDRGASYDMPASTDVCMASHCIDTLQNSDEQGVDCGGIDCPSCAPTQPTCNDGVQNQEETGIDCGGPCGACGFPGGEYSFINTLGQDVSADSLWNFFAGLGTVPASAFISFQVQGGISPGGWCSERADWYVNNYLTLAITGGNIGSTGWNKYYRLDQSVWSSAVTASAPNLFGPHCDGSPYSWCAEWGMGNMANGFRPSVPALEAHSSGALATHLTIRVAGTRLTACGF